VLWLRQCRPAIAAMALSALLALLADATICGIFSGPDDRYQGRLMPIAAVWFSWTPSTVGDKACPGRSCSRSTKGARPEVGSGANLEMQHAGT
jgi:hypothetical protein